MSNGSVLCPRCRKNRYTPYGEGPPTPRCPYPALSRRDNRTYICSPCGTEEALQDFEAARREVAEAAKEQGE